MTIYTIAKPC